MRKPRDDEEDVDADEASREAPEAGVEQDDRDDRDGPQAIDLRTVTHPRRLPRTNHSQPQVPNTLAAGTLSVLAADAAIRPPRGLGTMLPKG